MNTAQAANSINGAKISFLRNFVEDGLDCLFFNFKGMKVSYEPEKFDGMYII